MIDMFKNKWKKSSAKNGSLSKAKIRRIEMFELKSTIVKMKSSLDGFNSFQLLHGRMKGSKERIQELEDRN